MASTPALPLITPDDTTDPGGGLPRTRLRHLCAACASRRARFQHRGTVKADRSHTLCFQCFRAAVNRARLLASAPTKAAPASAGVLESRAPRLRGDPPDGPATLKYEELARRRHHAQMAARHALDTPEEMTWPARSQQKLAVGK